MFGSWDSIKKDVDDNEIFHIGKFNFFLGFKNELSFFFCVFLGIDLCVLLCLYMEKNGGNIYWLDVVMFHWSLILASLGWLKGRICFSFFFG